ncbi:helix-turn-helix domain-containing protein [Paenibacillus monticola]|uniref:Helix-turn-helix domain-containing protein n=1 Tax=Paenibacillus monticola TaxID=2666075 RepID=A0A7X2H9N5_9BACL|nr:helix-turn-helix domain-containing protein [Paenibacillus monticola]MRN55981.1 helix-turn-helix domain-containing protein [Paenibacillus monticola]
MIKYSEVSHIDSELLADPFWIDSLSKVSPEHTHDFYEFFIVSEGSCKHIVNGQTQLLGPGCLVFIRPQDTHKYERNEDGDCCFLNIPCRISLITEAFAYLNEVDYTDGLLNAPIPPIAMLSQLEMDGLIRHFDRFRMLSSTNRARARIYLKGILIDILTQYFSTSETARQPEIPLWLEYAVSKMQSKENLNGGLPVLYKLSGRSVGHVNRAFRQYLQQTPTEYINRLKLNTARNLLLTTELRVIEIALESGFENVSHFYHQFKKFYHQAPLDLRKNSHVNRFLQ